MPSLLVTGDEVCELLETYNGRDKVVRLACYVLKLWGSAARDDALLHASTRLSATRTALRLFDDIPMLRHTLRYGLGRHEPDMSSSILGVVGNLVDQLFIPVEKVVWLSEMGVLRLRGEDASTFDTLNTSLWATSLYIALLKSLKQLKHLTGQTQCLKLASEGEEVRQMIAFRHKLEVVTSVKLCLDIVHAVNCLPPGWLWGTKLDGLQVGAIATVSSLLGIGLHLARKRHLK